MIAGKPTNHRRRRARRKHGRDRTRLPGERPGNADTTRDARTTDSVMDRIPLPQSFCQRWPCERPMERAVELAPSVRDAVFVAVRLLRLMQIDVDQNLMRQLVRGGAADAFADRFDDVGARRIL